MDAIDTHITILLQQDARMTNAEIARQVGLARQPYLNGFASWRTVA